MIPYDALTLPISDWLFCSEGRASFDKVAILSVAFFPIQNYTSDIISQYGKIVPPSKRTSQSLIFKVIVSLQWPLEALVPTETWGKVPFKESLLARRRRPYLQRLRPGSSNKTKSYLNEWGNPEISKTALWTHI